MVIAGIGCSPMRYLEAKIFLDDFGSFSLELIIWINKTAFIQYYVQSFNSMVQSFYLSFIPMALPHLWRRFFNAFRPNVGFCDDSEVEMELDPVQQQAVSWLELLWE